MVEFTAKSLAPMGAALFNSPHRIERPRAVIWRELPDQAAQIDPILRAIGRQGEQLHCHEVTGPRHA